MGNRSGTPVLRQEDIDVLTASSGMEEAEVRECFDNFLLEHPKGKMKKGDFREMMQKVSFLIIKITTSPNSIL